MHVPLSRIILVMIIAIIATLFVHIYFDYTYTREGFEEEDNNISSFDTNNNKGDNGELFSSYDKPIGSTEEKKPAKCPCDCQRLSNVVNKLCQYPRDQLKECEDKILNFSNSCDNEKRRTQKMVDISTNLFESIKINAARDAADATAQLEDCARLSAYLEGENKKIQDDNVKLESWVASLKKQLDNVGKISKSCTDNTDKTTASLTKLVDLYQGTADRYVEVTKALPYIKSTKPLIGESLDFCISEPKPDYWCWLHDCEGSGR
jgi:hypothetical protein